MTDVTSQTAYAEVAEILAELAKRDKKRTLRLKTALDTYLDLHDQEVARNAYEQGKFDADNAMLNESTLSEPLSWSKIVEIFTPTSNLAWIGIAWALFFVVLAVCILP